MMNNQASGFDYNKLRKEAQIRWLKPVEIHYILQNHERYPIAQAAPQKPPSGSVFLFNKKVLRFFRKDGHSWRKKKDRKNVGEAHERLKVGNADTLNCYYAHGAQNPYFQRRSYWMLDPAYEHIVLVHYREVSEGRFLYGPMSTMATDSGSTFNQSTSVNNVHCRGIISGSSELCEPNGSSCSPSTVEEVSSEVVIGSSEMDYLHKMDRSGNSTSSPRLEVNQVFRNLAQQLSLDGDDNPNCFGEKLTAYCSEHENSQDLQILDNGTRESSQDSHETILNETEFWKHGQIESRKQDSSIKTQLCTPGNNMQQASQSLGSGYGVERMMFPSWNQILETSYNSAWINAHGGTSNSFASTGVNESSISRTSGLGSEIPARNMLIHDSPPISKEREKVSVISFDQPEQITWQRTDSGIYDTYNSPTKHQVLEGDLILQLSAAREFLLGSDNLIDSPTSISKFLEEEVQHVPDMWFDQGHFDPTLEEDSGLTVAQKQRFSIREISPEWAFSSESTKVIITGDFLCNPSECSWAVIFGSIEVPAEVVQEGVLRCHTPQHDAGKVPICLTSGNRESCSEVREFEFCAKPTTSNFAATSSNSNVTSSNEEQSLLVRLVHILLYGTYALSTLKGSIETESGHYRTSKTEDRWLEITEDLQVGSELPSGTLDWIIHELLKDKLQQRLSKYRGSKGTDCLPSKQEQGIIHMISGLGFDWALNPILDAGISIDFRDANGWTALHWAARFGREEMIGALLGAGASAQAVTDPTSQDPLGKTAGAIAADSGHTGLAGYLSEAGLTSHLLSLTIEENEISKGSAKVEAERAAESISQRSVQMHVSGTDDELSLKDFLAAARNATQAAARIQAAFRAHSFRKRLEKIDISQYDCGLTLEEMHELSASSMFRRPVHSSRDEKFDRAALSIQKKYRGWKGRKVFLTLRRHIVKIQAHVRGYQERKKYKEFLWTVGVLDKVILRWRRKGVGLRGYRAELELTDEGGPEEEDVVKVFRKQKVSPALDQAVSRVLSMVESTTARQQYRRMLERYRLVKAWSSTPDEEISRLHEDYEIIESDDFMN